MAFIKEVIKTDEQKSFLNHLGFVIVKEKN